MLEELGKRAKLAAAVLAGAGELKTRALLFAAAALEDNTDKILKSNSADMDKAIGDGMSPAMLDRLLLTEQRIASAAAGMRQVAASADPVGCILNGMRMKNGMELSRVTVPMGVIGIIYESRPNVTADCAALCLKAGSAVILRGGKEAYNSNRAIADIIRQAVKAAGLPEDCVQLIEDLSRESAIALMTMREYVDLLIPRGGGGLIRTVVENAKIPVIETGVGNCHLYVDKSADIDMAAEIVFNAKTTRPSVCNSAETLLVHRDIAPRALPAIRALLDTKAVELRACPRAAALLPGCKIAAEEDWGTEFLDLILAVKLVDSLDEAIEHIAKYSSGHSEAIITDSESAAQKFLQAVDSAAVYVNASTRFTDGSEFGLGAEIGISTQKLHARGPMGLEQLVSAKFIIRGSGQIR